MWKMETDVSHLSMNKKEAKEKRWCSSSDYEKYDGLVKSRQFLMDLQSVLKDLSNNLVPDSASTWKCLTPAVEVVSYASFIVLKAV